MKKHLKLLALPLIFVVASCAYSGNYAPNYNMVIPEDATLEGNNDEYIPIIEDDYIDPSKVPTSSFSLDSSSSAYTNLRAAINSSSPYIHKNQVIIEQLINYFDYDFQTPTEDPVKVYNEVSYCPWNSSSLLASIAVKTKEIDYSETTNNNYVFLIDVSGSMSSSNKLPLVQYGLNLLVDNLNKNDRVSLVTYSGTSQTLLKGVAGDNKTRIKNVINGLKAYGSTNGQDAIQRAYSLAKDYFIEGGNNHILMATDGDFNVGISSYTELEKYILDQKQNNNISFSTFGFGMGNYKNSNLETLALNGDGNVYYVDSESEAERLFSGNISSILKVVAKDAKIQVAFDPEYVSKYRLIGYENKLMTDEEFENDQEDAGEIYSNKTVIALYEIKLNEDVTPYNTALYTTEFKYKDPNQDVTSESHVIKTDTTPFNESPTFNFIFASSVAEFALALRDSKYKEDASYVSVIQRLENLKEVERDPLKLEFLELVRKCIVNEIVAK